MIPFRDVKFFIASCLVILCLSAPSIIAQTLFAFPSWTTATRPLATTPGAAGFNTQTNLPEYLDVNATWHSFASGGGGSSSLIIGTSPITGGVNTFCLFNNAGVLGNQACSNGFSVTDGVNTVNNATLLTISGALVGGTTPDATLTITGNTVASINDNGGGTLTFSQATGAVLGGCTTATTAQIGCSKPDGTTVGISSGGLLSLVGLPSGAFSISGGCGNTVTGGSITPTNPAGAINSAFLETRAVTTYPDTMLTTDCGGVIVHRSASNVVETLPQAGTSGFVQNYGVTQCNAGAGTVTLTPASGTIGKLSSYVLGAGTESARTCVGIYSGTYSGASNAFVSNDWGLVEANGSIFPATIQQTTGYSAAGTALPTCNTAAKGSFAWVTDATSPTFLATYTSGGAVISPVFCNGTNWITH